MTTITEPKIGWLDFSRRSELQEFIGEFWRAGHIFTHDAALLEWQYPRSDGELSWLVGDDERGMAAILGLVPRTFNVYGQTVSSHWPCIWTRRPDCRGLGMPLMLKALESSDVTAICGANEIAQPIYKKLEFHTVDDVPQWSRGFDAASLGELLAVGPYSQEESAEWLATCGGFVPDYSESLAIESAREVPSDWNDCWRELARSMVCASRDADYLRHRFQNHPRFRYQMDFVRRDGKLCGAVVWRLIGTTGGGLVLRIVELLGDATATAALASHICRQADYYGVAYAEFHGTGRIAGESLASCGFIQAGESRLPALFQPLSFSRTHLRLALKAPRSEAIQSAFSGDDLYVTRADGDQDRPN